MTNRRFSPRHHRPYPKHHLYDCRRRHPSNEGRGYVLRRLLRRAARHGRLLGINEPFLYQVVDTVVKENEIAYPELLQKKAFIKKVIKTEEENFNSTIGKGMELLNQLIDRFESHEFSNNCLPGEQVFKLYDTFDSQSI